MKNSQTQNIIKNQDNKDDKKKKCLLIILIFFMVCCLILGGVLIGVLLNKEKEPEPQQNGVIWRGKEDTTDLHKVTDYNLVDCFTELHLKANTASQRVNFYNDARNICYQNITVSLEDGTVLWSADNVYPNKGFHQITLNQVLPEGVYENCIYSVQFYTIEENKAANPLQFTFTLYVE